MRLALIQDQLLTPAGSERVFLYMAEEFREADLFTLAYNPARTWPEFQEFNINTTILNSIIRSHSAFKYMFPITTLVAQCINLYNYDIILSSSATVAKYIQRFSGVHLCYCYYPTRALWNFHEYFLGEERRITTRVARL